MFKTYFIFQWMFLIDRVIIFFDKKINRVEAHLYSSVVVQPLQATRVATFLIVSWTVEFGIVVVVSRTNQKEDIRRFIPLN